jgi:unsaturated rhamnogalacturonyl hydrolase
MRQYSAGAAPRGRAVRASVTPFFAAGFCCALSIAGCGDKSPATTGSGGTSGGSAKAGAGGANDAALAGGGMGASAGQPQAAAGSGGSAADDAGAAGRTEAGSAGSAASAGVSGASGSAGGSALVPGTIGVTVADYMMKQWPQVDMTAASCTGAKDCFSLNYASVPASAAPKFWEYTYGVPLYGVQKLFEKTGKTRYLKYVQQYVDHYVDENGTINYARSFGVTTPPVVADETIVQDVIQPSILLFGLYETTHAARYLTAMASVRKIFKSIPKNSAGAFYHKPSYPNQQWLDGIYMAEPFLAKYGALYAEQATAGDAAACFGTATEQIEIVAAHTFNAQKSLYYHAWNGAPDGKWLGLTPPTRTPPLDGTAVSPVLWSRSIGWLIAGVVDVLEVLPADHPERAQLVEVVRNVAAGIKAYQDKDSGLWYQVIDEVQGPPATGGYPTEATAGVANWLETSASAIFAYSLAKGVRLGVLSSDYLTVAKSAWAGVKRKIDVSADGTVVIHGTVVGLGVGGTYNAYANADFRSDLSDALPAPAAADSCPSTGKLGASPPLNCKYIYVRDNVPQGFGAVLLAATEFEF